MIDNALKTYLAAGLVLAMLPAGLMWSVVTESPRFNKTEAFLIGLGLGKSLVMPSKKGGLLM